jgi:hypothetical protein
MKLTGTLHKVFDTEQKSDKYSKREFILHVVEENGARTFDNWIKFQLSNDNCGKIDQFNIGQEITISYNLKGVKWEKNDTETVYFTNLEAWKIEAQTEQVSKPVNESVNDSSDLPF